MTAAAQIKDCPYDFGLRHPLLRQVDSLPPAIAWYQLKQQPGFLQGHRRYFYRYRTFSNLDWLRDIVVDGKLYLSSPEAFNDPFDTVGRVVFEGTAAEKRAELARKTKDRMPQLNWKERREHVDRLMADQPALHRSAVVAYTQGRATTGVCSFTDDPTSVVMWSHYAAQHSGLCIQFDVSQSLIRLLTAVRVTYSDEYPTFNFAKETKPQLLPIMLQKASHWSYERERRIVCPESANTNYRFRPQACTAAIVGCRADGKAVSWLHDLNAERRARGLEPMKLYRAAPSQSKYGLKIVPERLR